MTDQSRALFFVSPRQVEVRSVDVRAPGAGEVMVRTKFSGISSGTELLAYRGELGEEVALDESITSLATGSFRYPFQYGYSCAGYVEAKGARVRAGPQVGDAVFVFHPHQDRCCAPVGDVVAIGDTSLRLAVLFPLVETALQITLDAGPVVEGETVVVTGLGPVGLLTGALLARAGAQVLGSEPRAMRRAVAGAFGVEAVGPDEISARVHDLSGGSGVALLVESSGSPEALAASLTLLAHEGTALVASWYGAKRVTLPLGGHFHRRRLVIRSTQVSTIPRHLQSEWTVERRRSVARELMAELPLERLATHEFALDDAGAAYAAVDGGDPDLLHAALCYS